MRAIAPRLWVRYVRGAMTNAAKDELLRFIPGPSWVHPEVLESQARALIGHREELTVELHTQCEAGLRAVFQTEHRVLISSSSGSGLMEAGVRNLVSRRCLHLVCGSFSSRWFSMARSCGKEPEVLKVDDGDGISADRLADHLAGHAPYETLFITHNETSTGVVNPLAGLCEVARSTNPDMLICVDTVSSMAGVSIPVDQLGIDFCVTSSQKCFSLPPGLAFASVSPRALEKAGSVDHRGWYFDLVNLEKYAAKGHYPSTPALTLMYALARQLGRMLSEGLPERYDRHRAMADKARSWAETHAALFARPGFRSDTLTTVDTQGNIDFKSLSLFLAERGFMVAGGYGELKSHTFRVAHMGDIPLHKFDELLVAMTDFVTG